MEHILESDRIRLLDWAGFTKKKNQKGKWYMWYSPDKEYVGDLEPDTNSLDVLFKYFVPKFLGYAFYKQGEYHVAMLIPYDESEGRRAVCTNGTDMANAIQNAILNYI